MICTHIKRRHISLRHDDMGRKHNFFKNASKLEEALITPHQTVSKDSISTTGRKTYDVCIIGAGPHGLAVLSAHCSPSTVVSDAASSIADKNEYSNKKTRPDQNAFSVCVVDPNGGWLHEWDARLSALDIKCLRSPMMAHPDVYDQEALLRYAEMHGRLGELHKPDFTCSCLKGEPMLEAGMFDVPSSSLFLDFCRDLAATLPHDFVAARVESVRKLPGGEYHLGMSDAYPLVQARRVVCALGLPGQPNIPSHFQHACWKCDAPERCIYHTSQCDKFDQISEGENVVVVGGGLSAAQGALLAVKRGAKRTVMCSRRSLTTRQFDIPLPWLHNAHGRKLRYDFYRVEEHDRLDWIDRVRGGGSIPQEYMDQLEAARAEGKLELLVDDIEGLQGESDECPLAESNDSVTMLVKTRAHGTINATRLILATGSKIECMSIPLCKHLVEEFGLPVQSGLPVLSNDLQWGDEQIFVVGTLAMRQVGPDAANLMGARRAAQLCAWRPGWHTAQTQDDRVNPGARFTRIFNMAKDKGVRAPIQYRRAQCV
ncbi:hypothetical protein CYMTET_18231 [Cymbomonas tetramitiformis]|uniref:L-ornithine N(5)-monooxygenase [NAD(P)H] n=1 Tax=Cymbomonas tetramitiformis TaxID=36881 RepID=A0AAE0G941_9CHLO|nr:hypothetical protein CYMTET_18231 [Cymbomonas tetramitiformis]